MNERMEAGQPNDPTEVDLFANESKFTPLAKASGEIDMISLSKHRNGETEEKIPSQTLVRLMRLKERALPFCTKLLDIFSRQFELDKLTLSRAGDVDDRYVDQLIKEEDVQNATKKLGELESLYAVFSSPAPGVISDKPKKTEINLLIKRIRSIIIYFEGLEKRVEDNELKEELRKSKTSF